MTTLRSLLERRAAIAGEMRQINNAAGDNDLTAEQRSRFDELKTDLDTLEQRIARQSVLEDAERRAQGQPFGGTGDRNLDAELRSFSLVRAIAAQAGIGGVDAGRERELSAEIARRAGRPFQGIAVPMSVFHEPLEQRVLTTAAPAGGPGGNLIQTDLAGGQFIDRLRAALVIRRLGARVLTGLQGNLDIPALKASGTAGWVNENTALTPSTHEFRKVSMTPKHCGAITELSRNMLQQPSVDVENLARADFAQILADAVDRAAINGSGTAPEPRGVLNTVGINTVTTGGTPSWDNILEFISDLETSNTEGSAWLTHPKVVRKLRQTVRIEDSNNDPVDSNFIMEGPNTLAGYTCLTTTNVPTTIGTAPNNNRTALIFGNWSDLLLGYWSELDVLVNPFEATAYSKGNVQVRAMLTMDIAVRHAVSFSAAVDIT